MDYRDLDRAEFDAIVTGELTHYALWFEEQLDFLITVYFINDPRVIDRFSLIFLRSREFSTSRKMTLINSLLKGWADNRSKEFLSVITEVEQIIAIRNAMAHGRDVGGTGLDLLVAIQSHGGKTKNISITPDTHEEMLEVAERCLNKLKELKLLGPDLRNQRA
jgi:hypothetical protein